MPTTSLKTLLRALALLAAAACSHSALAQPGDKNPGIFTLTCLNIPDINRGAGLALILQLPSGKTCLYDTGSGYSDRTSADGWAGQYNCGRDQIAPFLKQANIKEIDTVFMSHAHADHFGGLLWLIDNVPIKRLVDGGYTFPAQAPPAYVAELGQYDALRESFKRRGAYQQFNTGQKIELDERLTVEVVAPPKEFFTKRFAESRAKYDLPAHYLVNANSLGLRITHGAVTFLLPGDIQSEDQIGSLLPSVPEGKLKCDVLVAPGHGIHAVKEFAVAARPKLTICSVFPRYAKGIPAPKIYGAVGSKVLTTGIHGQIQVVCDGKDFKVTAEKPE